MHEVLVNPVGGLGLPRKNVVRLTDRPDMTLGVYRGRKTTKQQHTFYNGSLSYLELYFSVLNFQSLSFLSISNITQNYRVSDSQGIQR